MSQHLRKFFLTWLVNCVLLKINLEIKQSIKKKKKLPPKSRRENPETQTLHFKIGCIISKATVRIRPCSQKSKHGHLSSEKRPLDWDLSPICLANWRIRLLRLTCRKWADGEQIECLGCYQTEISCVPEFSVSVYESQASLWVTSTHDSEEQRRNKTQRKHGLGEQSK